MGEQQALELVMDESGLDHALLWTRAPHEQPSSRPPARAQLPRGTARMPFDSLTRATLRMAPPPLPTKTLQMPRPTLVRASAVVRPAVPEPLPPPPLAPLREPPVRAAYSRVTPVRRLPQPPGVLASWPELDPRLVVLVEPDGGQAAAFRLLADNLLAKGLPRIVAVSSATQRDGTTTCAINVALALAENTAKRYLLVDANFFSPSLAKVFAIDETIPPEPSPDVPWVAPFKLGALTPCLHVATIVRRREEPPPRVDHRKLTRVIETFFAAGYDHVILDAPALDGSPAVSQLIGSADGVVLAVRSGRTTARALRRAAEELGSEKALGMVLMDAKR